MSILNREVASRYGALNSDTFTDGEALSAHVLRALAMSGNRLATKGHPLFNLVWPTRAVNSDLDPHTGGAADGGGFAGIAWPQWVKLLHPLPVPKKPMLNKAEIRIRARVTNGETILLQFATVARPFNAAIALDAPNVLALVGTGAMEDYDLDGVPISEGGFENFEIYVRASPSAMILGDTGIYGAPNAGTFDGVTAIYALLSVATWNPSTGAGDAWDEGGHFVEFTDASGVRVTSRMITSVTPILAAHAIHYPALSVEELQQVNAAGRHYRILRLPRFNFANIAAAASALEVL